MPKLVICERSTGTWNYHLRLVPAGEELKLGGGTLQPLCGEVMMAWDTVMPLEAWGTRDHIPSTWCKACSTHLCTHCHKPIDRTKEPCQCKCICGTSIHECTGH